MNIILDLQKSSKCSTKNSLILITRITKSLCYYICFIVSAPPPVPAISMYVFVHVIFFWTTKNKLQTQYFNLYFLKARSFSFKKHSTITKTEKLTLTQLIYRPYSNFSSYLNNVLMKRKFESWVAFNCHVSLLSFL